MFRYKVLNFAILWCFVVNRPTAMEVLDSAPNRSEHSKPFEPRSIRSIRSIRTIRCIN